MSKYVLKERNEDNSRFSYKEKGGVNIYRDRTERSIINMIKKGDEFYTLNKDDSGYTPVKVVSGDLESVNNDTKVDNIGSLPVKL